MILRQAGDLGFLAFPRGCAGPCDPLGGCGSRNRRSPRKPLSSARAEVPLGTASPAAQRVPGRVPKPPGPPPRPSPCPEPLTRLGCRAPLRAPQCRLQLRLQLGSHSGSGSRSDAVALGLGWDVAPLRLGLLCVQGRGAPAGPGRADPHPRSPNEPLAAVSGGLALPCRSPASPPVAVSTPPLAPPSPSWVLLGGGAAPRSQLGGGGGAARVIAEMGTRGRWERRAAPLCAQPARHPHSGGGRGQGGEEAQGCWEADAPGRCVKGGQTDTCREGWTNHMSEKDSQTGWTETRAKGRTEGGGGRRDTACWPLGWAEEPVRAASSQLLEFSSRRLGQGF